MTFKKTNFTRRQALTATAALTAASAAACSQGANQTAQPDNQSTKKPLVLDYKNPIWNRDALARIHGNTCLLYTSPSPRDRTRSRMPSSA